MPDHDDSLRHLKFIAYNFQLLLAGIFKRPSLLPVKPMPFLATLNLTENCQARCSSCNYWETTKQDAITTERAKSLIHEMLKADVHYLRIMGGEPLLRKDLFEILTAAPPNSFKKIVLCTNGLLLGKYAHQVNESSITNLTVSIDAVGTRNDMLRGVDGYFDQVFENLLKIKGKRIKIASVLTRHLTEDIDELVLICKQKGYDYDICLPEYRLPFAASSRMPDHWPSIQNAITVLESLVTQGMITRAIAKLSIECLREHRYPYDNSLLAYILVIVRANGDVQMGGYDLDPVGNIRQRTLDAVLLSQESARAAQRFYDLNFSKNFCNFQLDRAYMNPIGVLSYIRKRLTTNSPSACQTSSRQLLVEDT